MFAIYDVDLFVKIVYVNAKGKSNGKVFTFIWCSRVKHDIWGAY